MCRPVASLACVTGNGGVRSRDEKPNGKGSHHRTQGKAKVGMVKSMNLRGMRRKQQPPKRWM